MTHGVRPGGLADRLSILQAYRIAPHATRYTTSWSR